MYTNATTNGFDDDRRYYECRNCLERLIVDEHRASCPGCGGSLRNIGVPRE